MTDYEAAMELLKIVAYLEGKTLDMQGPPSQKADRDWVLKTFMECMSAVKMAERF